MRLLLDECLPWRLRHELPGHDVRTVHYMGWKGIDNGELLGLIRDEGFNVFLTGDQNLRFQQNLLAAKIAVIELVARSNRIRDLLPLVPQLQSALNRIRPGELIRIEA